MKDLLSNNYEVFLSNKPLLKAVDWIPVELTLKHYTNNYKISAHK